MNCYRTYRAICYGLLICLAVGSSCQQHPSRSGSIKNKAAEFWLTDPNHNVRFVRQPDIRLSVAENNQQPTINIDESKTFQSIDGFGYTLTGGSALLINKMTSQAKAALLRELFSTEGNNIGVSYLRISIGASDLDSRVFSYDDLPEGQTDVKLEKFSLDPDRTHLIPVLKQIMAINPAIRILGSPWSPPPWMKTNQNSKGGSLKPDYYDAYAQYLVKYVQGMKSEGIRIDAITIQNEPLHPGNNPSLLMLPQEQAAFIKQSLGPAFRKANIDTKLVLYDHNADRPDYPMSILDDPEARKYVDGSAFHLYAGPIEALSQVHDAHPDKNLYFTEQWIGAPGKFGENLAWHVKTLIIGATRNWARTVLEWNLAADPKQEPHTEGGCTQCLGAITLGGNTVTRNPAYYIIAAASKFVRPGSTRIASNTSEQLPNVAFKTPDGRIVSIILNTSRSDQKVTIRLRNKVLTSTLPEGSVGTYVW